MLLLKQDDITKLEDELNRLDKNEKQLFLTYSRLDKNRERKDVLGKLDTAFSIYGEFTVSIALLF